MKKGRVEDEEDVKYVLNFGEYIQLWRDFYVDLCTFTVLSL